MFYCSICINSIIPTTTPVLKRRNSEMNISSNDYFVSSNCKTIIIICNFKNNNVQTKDLKIDKLQKYNKKDDDPLDDFNDICFSINFFHTIFNFYYIYYYVV